MKVISYEIDVKCEEGLFVVRGYTRAVSGLRQRCCHKQDAGVQRSAVNISKRICYVHDIGKRL